MIAYIVGVMLHLKVQAEYNLSFWEPYFNNYFDSIWDLYVLVTTANNPDVIQNEIKEAVFLKRKRLAKAFDLIKVKRRNEEVVTHSRWRQLISIILPGRSETRTDLLMKILDQDNANVLSKKNFLNLADLLHVQLTEVMSINIPWIFFGSLRVYETGILAALKGIRLCSCYQQGSKTLFFSFHIFCVVIVLNIFTAFVLEAFILEYTLQTVPRLESVVEAKITELGLGIGMKTRKRAIQGPTGDKIILVEERGNT
ncbi:hypothetical protein Btru_067570 [Bulinus truncatus]|nr:hypothetical protein Btru_067570 [Bulinus truncatus]